MNVVIWTAFFLRMKNLRDDGIHSWSLLAAVTTVAALVAVPPCLLASNDLGSMTPRSWMFLLAMVLLPGVVGHGLMTWASGHLPVTVSSLLTLGSPVVSAVGAWLWLNQSMNEWQCVGSVIVLGALGCDRRERAGRSGARSIDGARRTRGRLHLTRPGRGLDLGTTLVVSTVATRTWLSW